MMTQKKKEQEYLEWSKLVEAVHDENWKMSNSH